jgi:hypothetical protein
MSTHITIDRASKMCWRTVPHGARLFLLGFDGAPPHERTVQSEQHVSTVDKSGGVACAEQIISYSQLTFYIDTKILATVRHMT